MLHRYRMPFATDDPVLIARGKIGVRVPKYGWRLLRGNWQAVNHDDTHITITPLRPIPQEIHAQLAALPDVEVI